MCLFFADHQCIGEVGNSVRAVMRVAMEQISPLALGCLVIENEERKGETMIDWGQEAVADAGLKIVFVIMMTAIHHLAQEHDSWGKSLSGTTTSGIFCLEVNHIEGTGKKDLAYLFTMFGWSTPTS